MGCSNSREFEIEDATLNPKMLEEDALARIHCCFHCEHLAEEVTKIAHVAEKFGALLAVDAEVDGIDRRGSTGVHGHFEWTFFCAASRRNAPAGRDFVLRRVSTVRHDAVQQRWLRTLGRRT